MTTITRESAEIKSFITGFLSDPAHDNQSSNSLLTNVFRIALASLEAEPVAWECGENIILFNPDTVEAYAKRAEISPKPLYAASPVSVTPDGWISCSERMPKKNQNVLISVNFDSDLVEPLICSARYTGSTFRRGEATIKPGNGIEQATHWMKLPEPPQEVN
ncbi:TPA: DUF551 domain-containing protein [Escherichia coli]|nr:DUF551 domain-containing protein [Escherichia coli]HAZ3647552.1 DUF551 domain-containing protein [Escherichia coli]HAZ3830862.1 DUF551 domain-containing protein [Escherichia coli]